MNSPKVTLPWEERVLHSLEQARNRALSAERARSLKELISSDYEAFWAEVAEDIEWFRPWQTVLEDGIPGTRSSAFLPAVTPTPVLTCSTAIYKETVPDSWP